MRLLIASFLAFSAAAALAATVETGAGAAKVGPQPSRQYIHPTLTPPGDPDVSWGKAGISYADYKHDAQYCAAFGVVYALNAPAWALSHDGNVWDILQNHFQASDYARIGHNDVERCLRMRGYTRFHLTQSEAGHLAMLQIGSEERRQYLYALGSDAAVVNSRAF
jgi:hypothetical protein